MLIALDVDGVIVDTVSAFLEQGADESYWKQSDLYDNMTPHPDAHIAIAILQSIGNVAFVSTCHCEHYWSKYQFLKKHFPRIELHNLKAKEHFPADILIDDRKEVLDAFKQNNPKAVTIQTSYGNLLRDMDRFAYSEHV